MKKFILLGLSALSLSISAYRDCPSAQEVKHANPTIHYDASSGTVSEVGKFDNGGRTWQSGTITLAYKELPRAIAKQVIIATRQSITKRLNQQEQTLKAMYPVPYACYYLTSSNSIFEIITGFSANR